MSLDTVVSKAFAVRRRRVPPTATGKWLPSFFFSAVSAALAIHGTMGPGMWLAAMMPTALWRAALLHPAGGVKAPVGDLFR